MKFQLISQQHSKLIVYFAGWGTPLEAVGHLVVPKGFDLLLCYDYRSIELDFDFSVYQEIHLVAWSLGVWVAERAMQGVHLHSAVAVNGTALPKDDEFGIPVAIFDGTLANLTEENRVKFERRMCSKADLAQYKIFVPRPFEAVYDELAVLNALISANRLHGLIDWQKAIIGQKDKIIPASAQHAYWQSQSVPAQALEAEHYLFSSFGSWAELLELKE